MPTNDKKNDDAPSRTATTGRTGPTSPDVYDSRSGTTNTSPKKGRMETTGTRAATTRSTVERVEATRKDDENAKDGYVRVPVPEAYGTLGAVQPDGTTKEFKTGEVATMPMKQAKVLGILDEDGNLRTGDIRAPATSSYGQANEPIEVSREDEGEGSPESGSDASTEEVGRAPR